MFLLLSYSCMPCSNFPSSKGRVLLQHLLLFCFDFLITHTHIQRHAPYMQSHLVHLLLINCLSWLVLLLGLSPSSNNPSNPHGHLEWSG